MAVAALLLIAFAWAISSPTGVAVLEVLDTCTEHGCATSGCRHDSCHVCCGLCLYRRPHRLIGLKNSWRGGASH